jgi:hypothetical protein
VRELRYKMQGDKIQDTNESYVSLREVYLESFTSFEDRLREGLESRL